MYNIIKTSLVLKQLDNTNLLSYLNSYDFYNNDEKKKKLLISWIRLVNVEKKKIPKFFKKYIIFRYSGNTSGMYSGHLNSENTQDRTGDECSVTSRARHQIM